MEDHHLRRPLLSTENTIPGSTITDATLDDKILSSTPTSCILQRVLLVVFVGLISVWANNEASKGFEIRVINDIKGTPLGHKFSFFFVSNDEATRLVQAATRMLSSDTTSIPEKVIDQVDVRLTGHNLTNDYMVVTETCEQKKWYVILVSPLVMESADFKYRIRKAIQRGMAEVLLLSSSKVDKQVGMTATHLCETLHSPVLKNNDPVAVVLV